MEHCMRMTRFLPAILFLAIAAGAAWYGQAYHTPAKNPDPNHTHADFAVWVDGKQLDFSGKEFMAKDLTPAELEVLKHETGTLVNADVTALRKYLHLHDGDGHTIHRHKPGLSLADFFSSLQVGFSGDCTSSGVPGADGQECTGHPFRLFVNGTEQPFDDLKYVFVDGDSLLITNAVDQSEIDKEQKLMTDDACRYSQTCPWRGEPPTENCIADPEVPCR